MQYGHLHAMFFCHNLEKKLKHLYVHYMRKIIVINDGFFTKDSRFVLGDLEYVTLLGLLLQLCSPSFDVSGICWSTGDFFAIFSSKLLPLAEGESLLLAGDFSVRALGLGDGENLSNVSKIFRAVSLDFGMRKVVFF